MILWKSPIRDGGVMIGIGLEAGNIDKLKKGQPILRSLDVIGYIGAMVTIVYGETKDDIIADLKKHGMTVAEVPPPGATGAYPHGKLAPDDEGELLAHLSRDGDIVRLDFGKPVPWLALSRHEAKEFAARLMEMAGETKDN
jgi:hypothetical protein